MVILYCFFPIFIEIEVRSLLREWLLFTAMEYHRDHGYIPLSQVVLHTTSASGESPNPEDVAGRSADLPPGLRRHLVVIHNQTFCITLRDTPHSCPSAGQCLHANEPHICVQQRDGQPPQATIVGPPTYEEALAQQREREEAEQEPDRPPRYSEACDDANSGLPENTAPAAAAAAGGASKISIDTEDGNEKIASLLQPQPRQVRFTDTRRRRHFSAQDRRMLENLLATADSSSGDSALGEDNSLRQRCFSFNALRDAFRRGSSQERQILLEQHTTTQVFTDDDSVFLSVELIGPDGHTSGGQPMPLPDDVTILNNIDRIEVLSSDVLSTTSSCDGRRLSIQHERQRNASGGPIGRVRASARQRHASAPDPSRKASRSRHSSGQP